MPNPGRCLETQVCCDCGIPWNSIDFTPSSPGYCRACRNKRNAAYREKQDKAQVKANYDKWREDNRDKTRKAALKWAQNNKHVIRNHKHTRRARLASLPSEPYSFLEIADRDNWICYLCDSHIGEDALSIDHVIPISKGGPDTKSNVRATHLMCNLKKSAKLLDEVLAKEKISGR